MLSRSTPSGAAWGQVAGGETKARRQLRRSFIAIFVCNICSERNNRGISQWPYNLPCGLLWSHSAKGHEHIPEHQGKVLSERQAQSGGLRGRKIQQKPQLCNVSLVWNQETQPHLGSHTFLRDGKHNVKLASLLREAHKVPGRASGTEQATG